MEKTSENIVQAIQELICLSYELKVQQMSRAKAGCVLFILDKYSKTCFVQWNGKRIKIKHDWGLKLTV